MEGCKGFFVTMVVVIIMAIAFWGIVSMDGDIHPNLPQNQEPIPAPSGPGKPDLSGFEALGLEWDCTNSSYSFRGVDKQVITASGESLLFYCDSFGVPLTKFCEKGVSIAKPGMHDSCKE